MPEAVNLGAVKLEACFQRLDGDIKEIKAVLQKLAESVNQLIEQSKKPAPSNEDEAWKVTLK